MSALKKIDNDTFSSNSTQLTYQKGWRLYWQNWMHAHSNILIHKTCELGANNIRCVILPPKSKQTKKDGWVTLSYTEPGQSTPMFLLPFFSLKGNIVFSTTYYGNIKFFVHRLRVNCIMLGKKVQNKWDLFLLLKMW